MRTVSVVPGMPFSILLFLHPDASENQLGAGLHGGWVKCCLELLREAGVALPVDGTQKYDGKVFRHRPEEWGTGRKTDMLVRCGQKINIGQIPEKLLWSAVWQIISLTKAVLWVVRAREGAVSVLVVLFLLITCWTIASVYPGKHGDSSSCCLLLELEGLNSVVCRHRRLLLVQWSWYWVVSLRLCRTWLGWGGSGRIDVDISGFPSPTLASNLQHWGPLVLLSLYVPRHSSSLSRPLSLCLLWGWHLITWSKAMGSSTLICRDSVETKSWAWEFSWFGDRPA